MNYTHAQATTALLAPIQGETKGSIPPDPMDPDIVVHRFLLQQEGRIGALRESIAAAKRETTRSGPPTGGQAGPTMRLGPRRGASVMAD